MMDLTTDLKFEGKQIVSWIKENKETGLIEIVFDTCGNEHVFRFEPDSFEAMAQAMNSFLGSGKYECIAEKRNGRIKLEDIYLFMGDDEKVLIEVDLGDCEDSKPYLTISSKIGGRLTVGFNEAQAKELEDRLRKIIQVKQLERDVQKKKTIRVEKESKGAP